MNLEGKTAVITGASRGLGKGMAIALAELGATVIVNYRRDLAAAEQTLEAVRKHQPHSIIYRANVRLWDEVEKMMTAVRKEFGRIDILINNAGELVLKPLFDLEVDNWDNQLRSNLSSVFYCCKAVLPIMREQNYGRIINIAIANIRPVHAYSQAAAHAIAKSGVLIMTRSLARENAPFGITINSISPGLMDNESLTADEIKELTSRVPQDRLGTAADLMSAVKFLLSDEAGYVTGTDIIVSGGWGL
jgi:3-oxoacyl-[acyl-carrier protein] reductase